MLKLYGKTIEHRVTLYILGDLLRSLLIQLIFLHFFHSLSFCLYLSCFLCHDYVYVCMSFIPIASMKNCGCDDRVLFESINSLTNPAHDRCGKKRVFLSFPVRSFAYSFAPFPSSLSIHHILMRVSFSFSNSSVMFFEWFFS